MRVLTNVGFCPSTLSGKMWKAPAKELRAAGSTDAVALNEFCECHCVVCNRALSSPYIYYYSWGRQSRVPLWNRTSTDISSAHLAERLLYISAMFKSDSKVGLLHLTIYLYTWSQPRPSITFQTSILQKTSSFFSETIHFSKSDGSMSDPNPNPTWVSLPSCKTVRSTIPCRFWVLYGHQSCCMIWRHPHVIRLLCNRGSWC